MTHLNTSPLVSVGIALFNSVSRFGGESVIRQSIDSLLAQDYPNVEYILVDNASDDETWNICQEYAAALPNVRIYRNDKNIGMYRNVNRVFELSRGAYYMIGSDDDYWKPTFISKCVDILENHPNVFLCYPLITEYNLIKKNHYPRSHLVKDNFQSPCRRAAHLLRFKTRPQTIILGVFRREALAEVMPIRSLPNGDLLLLYGFAFRYQYKCIPEVLAHKYVRPKPDLSPYSAQQYTVPTLKNVRALGASIQGFIQTTLQAPVSFLCKLLCLVCLLGFVVSGIIYVATLHKIRL